MMPDLNQPTHHASLLPKLAVGVFFLISGDSHAGESTNPQEHFAARIEPILREHCFSCHSHATGQIEAGLALDSQSGWLTGGDRGPAINIGQPRDSLLIYAIRRTDSELAMPPEYALSAEEIELLESWISDGARGAPASAVPVAEIDNDWWSLMPLQSQPLPATSAELPQDNPIDVFIDHQLAQQGLARSPRADRRTLIRRLYYDLIGMPPSHQQVIEFVNDPAPDAYRQLVEQLLSSPHYGERWARHWLDTIHFADTHGCEHDVFRPNAWRYRDYVVQSLNADVPWDSFVRQQIAADWFYPNRPEFVAALGFLAAGPLELSRASTAPVTFDYLDRDDIVTQVMASMTSTTVHCARCHDHKFDPISQEDYYGLQAVFAGAGKGDRDYEVDAEVAAQRQTLNNLANVATGRDPAILNDPQYQPIIQRWEIDHNSPDTLWQPLNTSQRHTSSGIELKQLEDLSILATGEAPPTDTYTITSPISGQRLTRLRLDVLTDDSLPERGPGRAANGNLHLNEINVQLIDNPSASPRQLKIVKATTDWNQPGWTIEHAIDGNEQTAWGIHPHEGRAHYAVFEFEDPVPLNDESQLIVRLTQTHGRQHVIGRFRIAVSDSASAEASVLPLDVLDALKTPKAQRSQQQRLAIASQAISRYVKRTMDQLPSPASVYGWTPHYSHGKKLPKPLLQPKPVHVLRRGAIDQPGPPAVPGSLSAIDALPSRFTLANPGDEASRRGALADWIVSHKNPLSWRSITNRVWHYHFGEGLCETTNDFGRMGRVPSHPELLDWLSLWFRDRAGGSLKELHRMILMSQTWQQSSQASEKRSAAASAVDQPNRMLWRMNRRPLDAESFRDSVLTIARTIDLSMGGPGAMQFTQSGGAQLTPQLDYDAFDWSHRHGARRSIYRVVWRGIADPFMEALNFPDLGLLPSKRDFSASALQSLTLYNNSFVLHHCQQLAMRITEHAPHPAEQISTAYHLVLQRDPSNRELEIVKPFVQTHGVAALCRVLFNSNEFMFVD